MLTARFSQPQTNPHMHLNLSLSRTRTHTHWNPHETVQIRFRPQFPKHQYMVVFCNSLLKCSKPFKLLCPLAVIQFKFNQKLFVFWSEYFFFLNRCQALVGSSFTGCQFPQALAQRDQWSAKERARRPNRTAAKAKGDRLREIEGDNERSLVKPIDTGKRMKRKGRERGKHR